MSREPIYVFADWEGRKKPPLLLGVLECNSRFQKDTYSFEASGEGLNALERLRCPIDTQIQAYSGRQYASSGLFSVFEDSSPDRWGRTLMNRFHERKHRLHSSKPAPRLLGADYLLGVHDRFRMGGLRFKTDLNGPFKDDSTNTNAIPTMLDLGQLSQAAAELEDDRLEISDEKYEWLKLLLAPGGSLGGARPKASLYNAKGQLFMAKFPSLKDNHDVAAWEMVAMSLAKLSGLQASNVAVQRFKSEYHTLITERFDRDAEGGRKHFASAMNLTGHTDGDNHTTGVSYLEIGQVLMQFGSQPDKDLRELWMRIVLNVLIKNTDDHLRNHGFLLEPGKGWKLSPVYDLNPNPNGSHLSLNISESDNALNLDLTLSVAHHYRLGLKDAQAIQKDMISQVKKWPLLAKALKLTRQEIERMSSAFEPSR